MTMPLLDRLLHVSRRSQEVLLVAGLVGVVVGLVVAAFESVTADVLFAAVLDQPVGVQALVPALGLAATALVLWRGRATPSTSDEYIRAFHDRGHVLRLRDLPVKLMAAVTTLGAGVPLGYEGPSIHAGATLGSAAQRRSRRLFTEEDRRVLLVAGAAAGVAAVFKAPVTGIVFALEVPYQDDLARRMLLPAASSAAAAYVTFAAIAGTEPLLPVSGQPPFNLLDLGGAALVGLAAGLLAHVFVAVISRAKALSTRGHPAARVAVAGAVLAGVALAGHALGDAPLGIGPGFNALRWALEPDHSVAAIVALGVLRLAGTAAAVGGGGTGGLFIPLVIEGALVGRAVGGLVGAAEMTLFPVVGMAAFLGAGYNVPLAAVVFVAEVTGRPGFVVPGLIAAVVAQLVMGRSRLSPYQTTRRVGHVEERLALPLSMVVDTAARTAPPDATVEEVFWQHLVATQRRSVAVVDGSRYLGLAHLADLDHLARDTWPTTAIADVMRTDVPTADPSWSVADALREMRAHDSDRIAVCDDGRFVGVLSETAALRLGDILDASGDGRRSSDLDSDP